MKKQIQIIIIIQFKMRTWTWRYVYMMVQYEGRMLVTALLTACTVPNPTSAASAALCSFAAMRLKIR